MTHLSHRHGVECLVALCGAALLRQADSTETCLSVLRLASVCGLQRVKSRVLRFTARNFTVVCEKVGFLDLSADELGLILNQDCVRVPDERQVLYAVLKWLHRSERRLEHAGQLLRSVRLATIDLSQDEVLQLKTEEAAFRTAENDQLLDQALRYRHSPADRWWMANRARIPRRGGNSRQVLAAVGLEESYVWIDENYEWKVIRHTLDTADCFDLDYMATYGHDYDIVCYGHRLFLIVWSLCKLFICEEFPRGIWEDFSTFPYMGQPKSLIAVPGYLYMIGYPSNESTAVHRLNLSTEQWEETPPVPHRVSFASCFYYDGKIYVFDEQVFLSSTASPNAVRGVHVFDLATQLWRNFDDPGVNWEDRDAITRIRLLKQRPACIGGKVYLCMARAGLVVFDPERCRFEPNPRLCYKSTSCVVYEGRAVWVGLFSLTGLDPESGSVYEWPYMPLGEDSEPVVVELPEEQTRQLLELDSFDQRTAVRMTPLDSVPEEFRVRLSEGSDSERSSIDYMDEGEPGWSDEEDSML